MLVLPRATLHIAPLPPASNYVFHGHGKGRGERGSQLEWCVGWQKEGIKGTWEVGEVVVEKAVDEIGVTVEK